MKMNTLVKKVNKVWRMSGFIGNVTEDNLSKCLKDLLETFPTLFKNELPDIYDATYVIVDLDKI